MSRYKNYTPRRRSQYKTWKYREVHLKLAGILILFTILCQQLKIAAPKLVYILNDKWNKPPLISAHPYFDKVTTAQVLAAHFITTPPVDLSEYVQATQGEIQQPLSTPSALPTASPSAIPTSIPTTSPLPSSPAPTSTSIPTPTPVRKTAKQVVKEYVDQAFGASQWSAFEKLINNESGWNPYAINPTSKACGLGQALPCAKMGCQTLADIDCQARWLIDYTRSTYGNPTAALKHWNARVPIKGRDYGHWW